MHFRHRLTEVTAIRWFKPGDHPGVYDFEYDVAGRLRGYLLVREANHIHHRQLPVYPGDYILTYGDGTNDVMDPYEFDRFYEQVE